MIMRILELAVLIIFVLSLGGMVAIFLKKAPLLASLPKVTSVFKRKENKLWILWLKIKEKARNLPLLKNFSLEIFLQKILSRFRVLALKIESKTGQWLEFLRKRSQENNNQKKQDDNYWQNLQKKKE